MNRRNFILGVGVISTGGSLAVGSGAFSSARIERNATINVVNDSRGLIGLVANDNIDGVQTDPDLHIDLTDPGINVGSGYQFGKFVSKDRASDLAGGMFTVATTDDPANMNEGQNSLKSAFSIVNQSTQTQEITLEFDLGDDLESESGTVYCFELQSSDNQGGERIGVADSQTEPTVTGDLEVGDSFGVSFIINTIEGVVNDNLNGSLTVRSSPK